MKLRETIDAAVFFQPHAVVTIDSKGFSFRFLKQLRGNLQILADPMSISLVFCFEKANE